MADGGDLRIVIQKISGETLETTACSEDAVGDLKSRIAREVNVPALCQRLVLHSVPQKLIFQRSLPHFSKELEKPLGEMEPRMYSEVRALSRPPVSCFNCIVMVLQLMAALGPSAFENLARLGMEPWNDGDWRSCTWKDCMMMTGPWNHLRQNLQRIATLVLDAGLDDAKVQAARSTLEDLGGTAAPVKMQRVSVLCYWLTVFVVEVLNVHEERQQTATDEALGSVELRNGMPISVYCTDTSISEGSLELALLADLEPAFQAIDGSVSEAKLEAVRALGDLGGKCPERSIPALCRCWAGWHTAEAAFRSLKLIASPGGEALELFLASSPKFNSFEYAVRAAFYLGPESREVWAGVVEGLVTGSREACLETFKEMLPTASVSQAIQGLLEAVFRTEFTAQSLDAVLREALVLLGERDHDGLMEGFVGYLDPAQPSWVQARASAWIAELAPGPEDTVAQAMLASLRNLHGQDLVTVAKSLVRISPASKPDALDALCKELYQATRGAGGRDMLLAEIENLTEVDDPIVLKRLMDFVARGERLLKSDGDWSSLSAAVRVLDQLDQRSRSFLLEAHGHLTRTAARFCHYKADLNGLCAEAPRHLLQLARAHGGVEHEVLVELRHGFRSQNGRIRAGCFKTFAAIPKRDAHQATSLLLQVINSDEHSWCRQAAIRAFELTPSTVEEMGPALVEEIKTSLLRAAEDPSPALRAAALLALRPFSRDEEVRCAAVKYFGDPDSFVKLEALGLLAEHVPVPFSCVVQSFQCQDSDVVSLGLQAFAKSEEDVPADRQEELCTILRHLLMHRDEKIAVGSARALGRLTSTGKISAITALEQRGIWPETRAAVLTAHQEALHALGAR